MKKGTNSVQKEAHGATGAPFFTVSVKRQRQRQRQCLGKIEIPPQPTLKITPIVHPLVSQ